MLPPWSAQACLRGSELPHSKAAASRRTPIIPSVAVEKELFKIGEVCRMADVQPYVLRYWETEFPPLAPNKSGGGQRLYTRREIDIILRIKQLLYSEGFTIAGAKKKLELELADPSPAAPKMDLAGVKKELRAILELLE